MGTTVELIGQDEFTNARLEEIYRTASMTPETNGQFVRVDLDGVHVLAIADPDKGTLRLSSLFRIKPQANRQQILEFCNRINDTLVMVRATFPAGWEEATLLLDHYMTTEAGITGVEVVDETRRFGRLVRGIMPLDTEKVLL